MNNTTSFPSSCRNISGVVRCRVPAYPPVPAELLDLVELYTTLTPIFTVLSYCLLSVALLGNLLIILTIFKDPKIRGFAHIFLLNIAIADVLYALVNFAGETLSLVVSANQQKAIRCSVFKPLTAVRFVCYAVAVFSLAVLSVERWHVICLPFAAAQNPSLKKKIKMLTLVAVWLLAVGISFPIALCTTGHERVHTIILAISLLVIPFLIILTANVKIIFTIRKAGIFEVSDQAQEAIRKRRHLLNLLFAIVISFILLWLPYTVLYIYLSFFRATDLIMRYKIVIITKAVVVTSYINPALNAIMYYGFCKDFRRGLVSLVRKSSTQSVRVSPP